MDRKRLGYIVAVIGLVMFLAGWNINSIAATGAYDHTPEAMYGGVAVFLAGVWIVSKELQ